MHGQKINTKLRLIVYVSLLAWVVKLIKVINFHAELQILEHPEGNSTVKYHNGEPACVTLNVSAVGSGCLSYRWKKNGKPIRDSIKCSGICEPTLIINGFSTDDQGEYSCIIKNSRKTIESNSVKMELGSY